MSALGLARGDALVDRIGLGAHNFARTRGLVSVDVGALEHDLRGAGNALGKARLLALGGHRLKA